MNPDLQCCGRCAWWKPIDEDRKFLGVCGHRDHGGEMTDRGEGENCADFECDDDDSAEWLK